jgi:hypothetical protein
MEWRQRGDLDLLLYGISIGDLSEDSIVCLNDLIEVKYHDIEIIKRLEAILTSEIDLK